ncbi:hypothetical protein SLEP1_g54414 [Rubroshorea leprosula]|uniref:Uncharacterized protein n=1 Tax=Rubroshorea leprosula TaxID=152421 RepID=A0AAV5MCA7_9ROSI|nr:hypothetical protein SLEP1_g54414 [Rubroshorea leprosula]
MIILFFECNTQIFYSSTRFLTLQDHHYSIILLEKNCIEWVLSNLTLIYSRII